MNAAFTRRVALFAAMACLTVAGQVVSTGVAAAVTVTKGELKNGQLRLEGRSSPNVFAIASSTASVAGARADLSGNFKIQASNFLAPDCTVTVSDGRTPTATVSLAGCTPSVRPVPPTPAPPSGSCLITPRPAATVLANSGAAFFFETTGCNTTTNSGSTPTPVQWTLVAGAIPTGMTGPITQGATAGGIVGTPTVPGSYTFTVQVQDQIGATDQETFSVIVTVG